MSVSRPGYDKNNEGVRASHQTQTGVGQRNPTYRGRRSRINGHNRVLNRALPINTTWDGRVRRRRTEPSTSRGHASVISLAGAQCQPPHSVRRQSTRSIGSGTDDEAMATKPQSRYTAALCGPVCMILKINTVWLCHRLAPACVCEGSSRPRLPQMAISLCLDHHAGMQPQGPAGSRWPRFVAAGKVMKHGQLRCVHDHQATALHQTAYKHTHSSKWCARPACL